MAALCDSFTGTMKSQFFRNYKNRGILLYIMTALHLLENERIERELQPHPFSFMHLHLLWICLFCWGIFLGWFFSSGYLDDLPETGTLKNGTVAALWLLGFIACGVIASLLMIRWRIFFVYLAIFLLGIGIIWAADAWRYSETVIPVYTVGASVIGLFIIELYRRSHRYFITTMRLVLRGGMIMKRERTLRYDKIADIDYSQGIGGRIFRYGNIIPVTQSGFGLGSDTAFAAGGAEVTTKKRFGFFGLAGGGKEVQTPRARTYYELHGVHPFKEVKALIEKMVQESTLAPYQREQVELQREMVDLLRGKMKDENDDAGE
ncbi:MAG: hypothetical protein DRN21_01805 [Thermoplasmata archaeon]|nr:MAG: hypothetical protein DRN21_01805 [Thermoplasmata archaeon]